MGRKFKDIKHEINTAFDQLLEDHEHNQLHTRCDYSAVRPAYAYTSLCSNKNWREGVTPGKYVARLKKK